MEPVSWIGGVGDVNKSEMANEKIVKMTWRTHWNTAKDLLSRLLIGLIIPFVGVSYLSNNWDWSWGGLPVVILIFMAYHFPVIYLYLEYTILSGRNRYFLSADGIRTNDQSLVALVDIARIEHVLSSGRYKKALFNVIGLNAYHYALIHLKNGQKIGPLTCLQSLNLDTDLAALQGVLVQKRHTLVPSAFPPEGI